MSKANRPPKLNRSQRDKIAQQAADKKKADEKETTPQPKPKFWFARTIVFFELLSLGLSSFAWISENSGSKWETRKSDMDRYISTILSLETKVEVLDQGIKSAMITPPENRSTQFTMVLIDNLFQYCLNIGSLHVNLIHCNELADPTIDKAYHATRMDSVNKLKNQLTALQMNKQLSRQLVLDSLGSLYQYCTFLKDNALEDQIQNIKYVNTSITDKADAIENRYKYLYLGGIIALALSLILKWYKGSDD